jgi:large subunit ribosomal protein L6
MSRIGKQPITLPPNTSAEVGEREVTIQGPKGSLVRSIHPKIAIEMEEGTLVVKPKDNSKEARALWGTFASHLSNMVSGVNTPYEKKLVVEGVGFRTEVRGNSLVLTVGFSHPLEITIPEGLEVTVEKNEITIRGIDKEVVGQFAAEIRARKKPEPYKGKGIRYINEVIKRKEGKKAV